MGGQYEWLEGPVGPQRCQLLKELRRKAQIILDNGLILHYTDHSIGHTDRVVQVLGDLLEVNLRAKNNLTLTDDELFVLIMSALYHDISMQIPKEHGIEKNIDEFLPEDYESIRRRHGEVSARILLNSLKQKNDLYELGILARGVSPYIPCVSRVVAAHQSEKPFDDDECVNVGSDSGSPVIRIGFLTALLRFADQLDCDQRRVDVKKLREFNISSESQLHWFSCHYIDAVLLGDGRIALHAAFPDGLSPSEVDFICERLIGKIRLEFDRCEECLWRNNVRLKLVEKVEKQKTDYSYAKEKLPERLAEYVRSKLDVSEPHYVEVADEKKGVLVETDDFVDWMTYWGMVGNPFLDYPLSYGSEKLVQTKGMKEIVAETGSFLKGPKGELKLLVAERGTGKTTLFYSIQGVYGQDYGIHIIDVAQKVADVRSAADLNRLIFGSIYRKLRPDSEDFSHDNLMESVRMGKKKVLCVDSLDRLPKEKDQIVSEFFRVAQHTLTTLKQNSAVLISCSNRWRSIIGSEDCPYLGAVNQWYLEPLSMEESKALIDRRLRTTGLGFHDVFEDNCLAAIHTLSKGNPREVLKRCEAICRMAAQKKQKAISLSFVQSRYEKKFGDAFKNLLNDLVIDSSMYKKALTQVYLFFAEMERRNLDASEGCEYFAQLAEGRLPRDSVNESFYVPLRYISSISQSLDEGSFEESYVLMKPIKEFLRALRTKGYSHRDFASYYSTYPYIPAEESDDLVSSIKSTLLVGDDVEYFEQARISYNEVMNSERGVPALLIVKSWEVIENLVVAILVKNGKLSRSKYELEREGIYYEDKYGLRRHKRGAGKILAEIGVSLKNQLFELLKQKGVWLDSLASMNWILFTRGNIVRGRSEYYVKYGKDQLSVCRKHLNQVFRELVKLYSQRLGA